MYGVMFRSVLGTDLKPKTKVMHDFRSSNEHLVTQSMVWGGGSIFWGVGQNSSPSEIFETDQHIL